MTDRRRTEPTERVVTETAVVDSGRTGLSWGAVFAGVAVTFTVMVVLNLLSMGIGLQGINLTGDATPVENVATGFGVIMVIVNLIALAAGGYVAGRYAGPRWHGSGFMQGLLTWAVALVASVWLMGSAAGTLVGSVGNIIGGGLSMAGQGISALAPGIAEGVDNATANFDVTTGDMEAQLGDLLRGTADEQADVEDPDATNPVLMDVRINEIVRSVFVENEDPFAAENREELISLMTDETDLTEAEAEEIVDSWERQYTEAQATLEEAQAQLTQTAEEAQDTLTWVMLLGAFALIVFAVITGYMGTLGARHRRPAIAASSTTTRVR